MAIRKPYETNIKKLSYSAEVVNGFIQRRSYASSKKEKKSFKDQMEMPSVEEQVKRNEEMRKAMSEGRRVKAPLDRGPSFVKIFGLAMVFGGVYALFQNYSLSGRDGPERASATVDLDMDTNQKQEITIIRRKKDVK